MEEGKDQRKIVVIIRDVGSGENGVARRWLQAVGWDNG
jgi:hypothetical protein